MSKKVLPRGWPVTVKGQVTIPKPVRDHLRLASGDQVEFEIGADGWVRIRKAEAEADPSGDRFARLVGRATAGLTTDEIMAMTRGED